MSCEWWPKRWDRGNKWTKWVSSIEHQGLRDTVSIKTAPSGRNEPADDPEQPEADNELSLFAVHCGVHYITVCSHYRKCFLLGCERTGRWWLLPLLLIPSQVFGWWLLGVQYFLSREEHMLHPRVAEEEVKTVGTTLRSSVFPTSCFAASWVSTYRSG